MIESGRVLCVAGMSLGDEGKGTICESLTRKHGAKSIVRYNGGAQASHHVVRDDGIWHAFHQFGSGTFEGARTHLSRFHLFDPIALADEAKELRGKGQGDALERLTVDGEAPLVTLYHVIANQIEETARGKYKHGSCGAGIWQTQKTANGYPEYIPRAKHLANRKDLIDRLAWLQELKRAELKASHNYFLFQDAEAMPALRKKWTLLLTDPAIVADMMLETLPRIVDGGYLGDALRNDVTIFEGAQGVLLDQDYGFVPHVTGTTTTFKNAETLLSEAGFIGDVHKIGVTRTYMTRHGAGPMPTERDGYGPKEKHNGTGEYQGNFRTGPLDLPLLRYALKLTPVDSLAITHVDADVNEVCWRYSDWNDPDPSDDLQQQIRMTNMLERQSPCILPCNDIVEFLGAELATKISITSHGPKASDKCFLTRDL